MRDLTTIEIDRIKIFAENTISTTLIEITKTGLEKGIMDATGSVRSYLKENDLHDYEFQKQGAKENGVIIDSIIVTSDAFVDSKASLYRPKAKKNGGDPRIWFYGISKYCSPNDILALISFEKQIWVVNLTKTPIESLINSSLVNPIKELINDINRISNVISDELLIKLRNIASAGFIPALLQADTSIGRTLEHLLGIQMNSSKSPDYKGIELKSARENKGTRKGLFAQKPNWELSKFKNRNQILDEFGYWEKGIYRLYNTIRATGRNAQGLILKTDYELDHLLENSDNPSIGDFLTWKLEDLKSTLIAKHKETFWIEAESKMIRNEEYFLFKKVVHTKNPLVNQFGLLIDIGAITVDYNMKRKADGKVEDKGCNFKLRASAMSLLFPPSKSYSLITK
ncbi:MvaI/BcnI family restriction endonuclease [Flavobacterium sp. K5-23]|uniref:MvaI/BcnI family restriction endonuclease n=1 Tax=Flavobacterium sp. K5-23 TaxID=2746225 RepID=UPI00200DFA60|nr:MvaI/BcnI family restriction endonuclease [Flavobacterium sp. K5-23]UQD55522.1 MvaI/BcnI restriction endonuclease family protein [Flavobacterium sp. K5-23]